MHYPKSKVYFDGSHYIAIPHTEQLWKKRKNKGIKNRQEETVKEIIKKDNSKSKKEKIKKAIETIDKEINDTQKATELVNKVLDKEKKKQDCKTNKTISKS